MAKKKVFETSLNKLEEIVKKMEEEDTSLEKAMNLYKEGVSEAIFCSDFLKNMEKEVSVLKKTAQGYFKLDKFEDLEEL